MLGGGFQTERRGPPEGPSEHRALLGREKRKQKSNFRTNCSVYSNKKKKSLHQSHPYHSSLVTKLSSTQHLHNVAVFFLQKSLLWMQLGVISTLGKWTERKKRLVLFPGKLQEQWKKKSLKWQVFSENKHGAWTSRTAIYHHPHRPLLSGSCQLGRPNGWLKCMCGHPGVKRRLRLWRRTDLCGPVRGLNSV